MSMTDKVDASMRCQHCNRDFVRPSAYEKHVCEKMKRWLDRDHPVNRIAYMCWRSFVTYMQPARKNIEYMDFASSPYYVAMIKYGDYCVSVNAIDPIQYTTYLIKHKVSIDKWGSDSTYEKYLIEYLKIESSEVAIARTLENLEKLARDQNIKLADVFKYLNANKLCSEITNGRISPWFIYASDKCTRWLGSLNESQIKYIWEYINPEIWNVKILRDSEDFKNIKNILNSYDI